MTINLPTTAELSVLIFGYVWLAAHLAIIIVGCITAPDQPNQEKDHGTADNQAQQ